MLNTNELRIGNAISFRNGLGDLVYAKAYAIESDKVAIGEATEFGQGWMGDKGLDPIPITPEILEQAGYGDGSKFINGLQTTLDLSGRLGLDYGMIEELTRVKYVHQLQNLYFALTGKELKIEL